MNGGTGMPASSQRRHSYPSQSPPYPHPGDPPTPLSPKSPPQSPPWYPLPSSCAIHARPLHVASMPVYSVWHTGHSGSPGTPGQLPAWACFWSACFRSEYLQCSLICSRVPLRPERCTSGPCTRWMIQVRARADFKMNTGLNNIYISLTQCLVAL